MNDIWNNTKMISWWRSFFGCNLIDCIMNFLSTFLKVLLHFHCPLPTHFQFNCILLLCWIETSFEVRMIGRSCSSYLKVTLTSYMQNVILLIGAKNVKVWNAAAALFNEELFLLQKCYCTEMLEL